MQVAKLIRKISFLIFGLLAGSTFGFFCANNFSSAGPVASLPGIPPSPAIAAPDGKAVAASPLAPEEIAQAIATADQQPDNSVMQRKLGLGLYQYARAQVNAPYLSDVARLLIRAQTANPRDTEVIFALGNTQFVLAQRGTPAQFAAARRTYQQLLVLQPDNADAHLALGLTYHFGQPSQNERALAELQRAYAINPRQDNILQALATLHLAMKQRDKATQFVNQLAGLDPQHPALAPLRAQIAGSSTDAPPEVLKH